jgi:hypothetical protein
MIIAGINLIMHTSRIDEQIISNRDKHITSTLNASTRNCNRNCNRYEQIAYGAVGGFTFEFRFTLALALAFALAPASSAMSSM